MSAAECTAYFDDSGHPDDQDAVIVAGWVATVDQWLLFEKSWQQVLEDFGIKSGVFHMTDFEASANEYSDLSPQRKCSLLNRLIAHIRVRTRYSFVSIVPMADYKEINDAYCFEEVLGKPYAFAAVYAIQRLKQWKNTFAADSPLVTVFEDGTKHKGDLMAVFKQFEFDDPIFRKKKDVVALQAADMLGWECLRAFKTGDLRRSFDLLLEVPGRQEHGIFTTDNLAEACKNADVFPRDPNKQVQVFYSSEPKRKRIRRIWGKPEEHKVKGIDRL